MLKRFERVLEDYANDLRAVADRLRKKIIGVASFSPQAVQTASAGD
jgi:hypothetical protein